MQEKPFGAVGSEKVDFLEKMKKTWKEVEQTVRLWNFRFRKGQPWITVGEIAYPVSFLLEQNRDRTQESFRMKRPVAILRTFAVKMGNTLRNFYSERTFSGPD